ncbi:hypothetical protein Tco_1028793 [Tanacetum coccineum]|uniref:Uncharacterized protein n=1 Tax=Tanacetum coccineum TaxID=301880 RepID=A0ABQ5G3E6_9ASTR
MCPQLCVGSKATNGLVIIVDEDDDMGNHVAQLFNAHLSSMGDCHAYEESCKVFYGRCHTFEEVAKMKDPFDITKVKGYRSSYKQEHTKAGNDLATATFPFLTDVAADPYASVEVLLSKKPQILQRPAPIRTQMPTFYAPSHKATPSPALMSPAPQVNPATASSSKAQSPPPV